MSAQHTQSILCTPIKDVNVNVEFLPPPGPNTDAVAFLPPPPPTDAVSFLPPPPDSAAFLPPPEDFVPPPYEGPGGS